MSDALRALLAFWAVVNLPAVALSLPAFGRASTRARASAAVAGAAMALALVALAVTARGPLLDALDISAESFRLAAGLIVLVGALPALVRGVVLDAASAAPGWRAAVAPLAVPLLAGPPSLALAVAVGERYGAVETVAAAAAVIALTAAALGALPGVIRIGGRQPLAALARVNAALAVAIAVELIVDGLRSV